ncbi:twin-arginine translocase TatA/TatE family subunit [Pontibacter diazotrophicus]|uniref:Sec-independent protein translocase protein TatA n=1 Tax=Pontibacter diazotrophicus TaxID=1400979 RepID=A0A3D8L729_9BACT|nr:twin-arginine translocase TatA/TatE family subunit [Pontibacter diazotrophicus]RDV13208.1 twin-arginine translocase TatA/TatE family subunit [Pontibacter diazotrophicus]
MEITNTLLFIGGLGGTEIFLILFVILLLFGAKRIPELARGMGRGIREFKDATKEIKSDIENSVKDDSHTTTK